MFNNNPDLLDRSSPNFIEKIKKLFRYDPETGKVYYKVRDFGPTPSPRQKQWNTRFADKEAGYFNGKYLKANIEYKSIYLHQIAFAIMEGYIPIEVDHEDLDKLNNKWNNLRNADRFKNSANNQMRYNNKAKLKGVSWAKSNNCWRMDIAHNKIKYHSYHPTKEAAYKAYCEKSAELHKEFGRVD